MLMSMFFLNHRTFSNKDKSKTYNVLTCCDSRGEVSEFFHEPDISIPSAELFQPLDLDVNVTMNGGKTRVTLLGVSISPVSHSKS